MSPTLTPFDHQIAVLAVSGMRQRAVAKQLHVHYNTVWRALHKPAVQELVEALLVRTEEESTKLLAERLEAAHQAARQARQREQEARRQRRKECRSRIAPWQGQGTALAREPSDDPHWPIRQYLTQQPQAEEQGQEQDMYLPGEPDPQPPRRLSVMGYLDQVAPWPDLAPWPG